jgi:HEAT repeat protein
MLEQDQWVENLSQLADPDPSTRRWAAEALGDGDERALYPLIKALRDTNPGVQDAARRSLINIGGEVTAYMTLPLLREDAYMRNTSRIILKQIGSPAVPLFQTLLKDKDDDIRIFALDLISEIQQCDFSHAIEELLQSDPNVNARSAAARALGRVGGDSSLPALRKALSDTEWVCISALESLAERRDGQAIPDIAALLSHPSETVRYSAIEALGHLASDDAKRALLDSLENASALEKSAIVKSLVQIGVSPNMSEAYDVLVEILRNGDLDEKIIAIRGLSSLKDPRAIPIILDEAGALDPSDPSSEDLISTAMEGLSQFDCDSALISAVSSPEVRHMGKVIAIEVLAALECSSASGVLIDLMAGDLREVRRASARALGEFREDSATQQLRDSIEDRDGHVRRAAAIALGKFRDRAAFEPLYNHLSLERYRDVYEEVVKALLAIDETALGERIDNLDSFAQEVIGRYGHNEKTLLTLSESDDRAIKLAAISGLGNVSTDAVVAHLENILKDSDSEIRRAAVISLGNLQRGLESVRALLEDEDIWVRMSAATALGEGDGYGGPDEGYDDDPWR